MGTRAKEGKSVYPLWLPRRLACVEAERMYILESYAGLNHNSASNFLNLKVLILKMIVINFASFGKDKIGWFKKKKYLVN